MSRIRSAARFLATTVALWMVPLVVLAGGGEKQGKLVFVADTRELGGINLHWANLYNTDPLLFTLEAIAITAAMGYTLGLVMDLLVSSIGLDLGKQESKE